MASHVLVFRPTVNDHPAPVLHTQAVRQLEAEGWHVTLADERRNAIDQFYGGDIEMLILDSSNPELLRALQDHPNYADLAVMLMDAGEVVLAPDLLPVGA